MIVFRVQDKDGRGPWKPGFSHIWVRVRRDHDNLKPFFMEFSIDFNSITGHIGCGCLSVPQLKRWFSKREYKTLLSFGYRCVKIEAEKILASSDIQCVFSRRIPLNESVEVMRLY
jgi:hypothetical protein